MLVCFLALSLVLAPAAWAGSVVFDFGGTPETLTTNAKQDDKLVRLQAEHNQGRAGATPPLPPLTLEQFVREVLVAELKNLSAVASTVEAGSFCTAYATWTQPQKDQVYALGGNNSPCP